MSIERKIVHADGREKQLTARQAHQAINALLRHRDDADEIAHLLIGDIRLPINRENSQIVFRAIEESS